MDSDVEMYKFFLHLINKEKTHTIIPAKFNLLINPTVINWAKSKLPTNEFNQIRIDDLSVLFIADIEAPIIADTGKVNIFSTPDNYMHGNRARFRLNYINSPCFDDGEGEIVTSILLKTDRASAIQDSHYLRPTDKRTYFRYLNSKIQLLTGLDSGLSETIGTELYLEYYKYPELIEVSDDAVPKDIEFNRKQAQEIVELAAQEFLEANRDPRYQTFLNEQISKNRI